MATKTKSTKRKIYTVAQKRRMISNWKQAKKKGVTFKAFCQKNKVSETSVRNWMNNGVTVSKSTTKSTAARRKNTTGVKARRVTRVASKTKVKSASKRGTAKRTTSVKKPVTKRATTKKNVKRSTTKARRR